MKKNSEIIAQRVFPIGKQTLYRIGEDYFIEIVNRTYYSRHKIDKDKVEIWKQEILKKKI